MNTGQTGKKKVHIHIGGFHASREPVVVETILGSCVAVCLYDPLERIGGMNHILLPGKADLKHFDSAARYGVNAMELLINAIMALGGSRARLVAKVFGGAHVLPAISMENGTGRKNAEFVVEFLQMQSINIISEDVGGHVARKVHFHTDSGDVFLKRIPCTGRPRVSTRERRMLESHRKGFGYNIEGAGVRDGGSYTEATPWDQAVSRGIQNTYLRCSEGGIRLRSAFQETDAAYVKKLAPSLTGAFANVAAHRLREIAMEIEDAGEHGDLVESRFLLQKLELECEVFQSALSQTPSQALG